MRGGTCERTMRLPLETTQTARFATIVRLVTTLGNGLIVPVRSPGELRPTVTRYELTIGEKRGRVITSKPFLAVSRPI